MPAWVAWLLVAGALGAVEVMSLAFAAGLMAAAALAAAIVAAAGGHLELQAVAFAVASFAGLAAVRPLSRRRQCGHRSYRSGVDALTERPAIVLTRVDALSGTVRIGGEVWSARAFDETQVIAEGSRVTVFQIDGATALVYPKEFI